MANKSNWKGFERELAGDFSVKRNINRGANFSKSESDTTPHPVFSLEAKKRKTLPALMKKGLEQAESYFPNKVPIVGFKELHQRGYIICINKDYFQNMYQICLKYIIGKDKGFNCNIKEFEEEYKELIIDLIKGKIK